MSLENIKKLFTIDYFDQDDTTTTIHFASGVICVAIIIVVTTILLFKHNFFNGDSTFGQTSSIVQAIACGVLAFVGFCGFLWVMFVLFDLTLFHLIFGFPIVLAIMLVMLAIIGIQFLIEYNDHKEKKIKERINNIIGYKL